MSRFQLYGGSKCDKCAYYRRSLKCPVFRCDQPDNLKDGWFGVVYMQCPESKNWNYKCPDFKEKINGS